MECLKGNVVTSFFKSFARIFMLAALVATLAASFAQADPVEDPLKALMPPDNGKPMQFDSSPDFDAPTPKKDEFPPVARFDEPRTDEPMEDYTEYYERKVHALTFSKRYNRTLTYFWLEPHAIHPKEKKYPLIVVLHDDKGIAHAAEYLMHKKLRENFPAYVYVPVLPVNKLWAFPSKLPEQPKLEKRDKKKKQGLEDAVKIIPDLLRENPGIDARRVYVIGCAEGGFGAFGAVLKYPDIFAASVPISGGWSGKDATKMTKVPLFVLHGEKDTTYTSDLSQNTAWLIQNYGGKVYYINVPGMGQDCSSPRLYQTAVWHWMFKQRK